MEIDGDREEPTSKERGQYSQKYTKDALREAIEKIRKNELSYGQASQMYNVPKTTLHNKMKNDGNEHNSPRGASTTLSKAQEDELSDWILLHQRYGDPRTKHDIILAAGEIAKLDEDNSKHFKNGLPTTGWVEGFLQRHPDVVYRTPEAISKASAINTKEDFSKLWRNIYDYMLRTNQLHLLHKPEIWWNADETSFKNNVIPKKVLAKRGSKNVHHREMGKPKENTTVTYAFSAAGDYAEPLITLKNSNSSIVEISFALGSVGANYGINQTDSGWAKEDSFYYYVTMHLHKQWELKNTPRPRILTIDGYKAHLSLRLFRWARLNDLIIIVLYPGGTPYLQMCDTTMFRPMNFKHIELFQQWRLTNPTKTMNDVEMVKILKQVNDAVIRKESIINGWRGTGLQPFDFNNLNCDDLISKSPDFLYDFKGDHICSSAVAPALSSAVASTSIPDFLYDFKGDHFCSSAVAPALSSAVASTSMSTVASTSMSTVAFTSTSAAQKSKVNVISCVVLDNESEFYIEPEEFFYSTYNDEVEELNNEISKNDVYMPTQYITDIDISQLDDDQTTENSEAMNGSFSILQEQNSKDLRGSVNKTAEISKVGSFSDLTVLPNQNSKDLRGSVASHSALLAFKHVNKTAEISEAGSCSDLTVLPDQNLKDLRGSVASHSALSAFKHVHKTAETSEAGSCSDLTVLPDQNSKDLRGSVASHSALSAFKHVHKTAETSEAVSCSDLTVLPNQNSKDLRGSVASHSALLTFKHVNKTAEISEAGSCSDLTVLPDQNSKDLRGSVASQSALSAFKHVHKTAETSEAVSCSDLTVLPNQNSKDLRGSVASHSALLAFKHVNKTAEISEAGSCSDLTVLPDQNSKDLRGSVASHSALLAFKHVHKTAEISEAGSCSDLTVLPDQNSKDLRGSVASHSALSAFKHVHKTAEISEAGSCFDLTVLPDQNYKDLRGPAASLSCVSNNLADPAGERSNIAVCRKHCQEHQIYNLLHQSDSKDEHACCLKYQHVHVAPIHHDLDETTTKNDCINLSELSGPDGIFRSKFDTNFDLAAFGMTSEASRMQNERKLAKFAERMRRDLKEIGLLCAATEKQKLINVLIINQQLNFIDPPPPDVQLPIQNSNEPRTIKTILKPPTMPERVNPKYKRNLKVGYGVVTSNEVIGEMEDREIAEAQQEIEREVDEIAKNQREKEIEKVDKQLREARKELTILKSENAAKIKETVKKRKSKRHDRYDANSTLQEDAKFVRLQEIQEKSNQLNELRNQLKTLKANHIAANKSVAVKRRNFIEQKKEKGNFIMPSVQQASDDSDS